MHTLNRSTRSRRARTGATVSAVTIAVSGAFASSAAAAARAHRVEAGDTLAEVAADHGFTGDAGWRRLYDANPKIGDPDLIEVGQTLRIPARSALPRRRALPDGYGQAPATITATSRSGDTSRSSSSGAGVWDELAQCESGGDWSTDTGNGYSGGLQFSQSTWEAYGGSGSPSSASREEQIAVAERVQAGQGWGAWPGCSAELGL